MRRSRFTAAPMLALVALALASGCASEPSRARRAVVASDAGREPSAPVEVFAAHTAPPVGTRLRHTVTLGESWGDGALRRVPNRAQPAPQAPPSSVPSPSYPIYYGAWPGPTNLYGYDGWFSGCCARDVREPKPRPSPDRPPALGEDWAPPPQTGPRFPFKTAPADPWK